MLFEKPYRPFRRKNVVGLFLKKGKTLKRYEHLLKILRFVLYMYIHTQHTYILLQVHPYPHTELCSLSVQSLHPQGRFFGKPIAKNENRIHIRTYASTVQYLHRETRVCQTSARVCPGSFWSTVRTRRNGFVAPVLFV